MAKKPPSDKGKRPIQVEFIHKPKKFSGYHSEHYEVVFPDYFTGPIVQEVFSHMTLQFGRDDYVHFKHRQDIVGFEIIVDDKATANTLDQIRGTLERIVGRVIERPAILQLLDQMPKDPRYN